MRIGIVVSMGVVVAVGFWLADLPSISVCSGSIVDTNLCEAAQLRQSIFAAALASSGIVAGALMIAAFLVRADRLAVSGINVSDPD